MLCANSLSGIPANCRECLFKHPPEASEDSGFTQVVQQTVHKSISLLNRLQAAEEKILALERVVSNLQAQLPAKHTLYPLNTPQIPVPPPSDNFPLIPAKQTAAPTKSPASKTSFSRSSNPSAKPPAR